MSELFIELFSEEVPAKLQIKAREQLKEILSNFFEQHSIKYKGEIRIFSTPNRIAINAKGLPKEVLFKSKEVKGPSINAPDKALDGFLNSNQINKNKIYKKKTEKGEFYFYKKPQKKISLYNMLRENLPHILFKITWEKSMKWGEHNLLWGRPLKSILSIFDGKKLEFDFKHLKSSNLTFIEKDIEEKTKSFNNFDQYLKFFKTKGVIINHEKRKDFN